MSAAVRGCLRRVSARDQGPSRGFQEAINGPQDAPAPLPEGISATHRGLLRHALRAFVIADGLLRGRVGVLLVYKRPGLIPSLLIAFTLFLQSGTFLKWAMPGSNQRTLPCEFSAPFTAAYRSLRELAYLRRFHGMSASCFYAAHRRFTPALLHGCCTSAVPELHLRTSQLWISGSASPGSNLRVSRDAIAGREEPPRCHGKRRVNEQEG
jgi:hypothetical protein